MRREGQSADATELILFSWGAKFRGYNFSAHYVGAGGIVAQFSTFFYIKSAFYCTPKCELGRVRYGVDPGYPRGANNGGRRGPLAP